MTDTTQQATARNIGVDDIVDILTRCVAAPDLTDVTTSVGEAEFDDLGYDSLAVLECAGALETEFGVLIPDEILTTLKTPQQMVDFVRADQRAV